MQEPQGLSVDLMRRTGHDASCRVDEWLAGWIEGRHGDRAEYAHRTDPVL